MNRENIHKLRVKMAQLRCIRYNKRAGLFYNAISFAIGDLNGLERVGR